MCFHPFEPSVKVGLPLRFTYPFAYTPHQLCVVAAGQVQAYVALQTQWRYELQQGKMFGVLVVRSPKGHLGFLTAFSGQIAGVASHPFFVPPVFDYLQPDGYFKKHEAEISAVNKRIADIENADDRRLALGRLDNLASCAEAEIGAFKLQMADDKRQRDALRKAGGLSTEQEVELIRQSQFQKAELKRLKLRWSAKIGEAKSEEMSFQLQNWLFTKFVFLNARGEKADLLQIFESSTQPLPPAGAGECCAPKLLQYAYVNGYTPLCMAEFWWGNSPKQEVRRHGEYYPACKSKCEPILRFMLQGLSVEDSPVLARAVAQDRVEVVFEDDWYIVVNKPSGMLSVPGKINADSLVEHLRRQRTDLSSVELMVVHRLDMDTSGLLVIAKSLDAFKKLQNLFETRQVHKRYTALLNGRIPYPVQPLIHEFNDQPHPVGRISLPLCPDVTNRPHQMVSYDYGKEAVTFYEIVGYEEGYTRVSFFPQTGRTHQLRVHAAHSSGLNTPIVGDDLYGTSASRLCLHAAELVFVHPFTQKTVVFCKEAGF